jgi:hypothetical protein
MKKLMFLSVLFTLNVYALDSIETAIMESDPQQLEIVLNQYIADHGPLKERQVSKYLDFAQNILNKRYETKWWDKFWPDYRSGKLGLGALLMWAGIVAPVIYTLQNDKMTDQDVKIMHSLQSTSIITSLILVTLGIRDLNAYKQKNIQLYDNALEVKQIIYNV